jgi:peptidoglycan/xylan/chitin deacetylase (PgdA/CDA1 family)
MVMAFAAGAVVGLIGGLAFGGGEGKGTSGAVQDDSGIYSEVNAASEDTDPYAGEPMTAQRAELIGSNELGQVLVIVYYGVSPDAADGTTRTPDQLRDDLALLESEGFYPVNVRDLVTGDIDVPAGKSPVVITFDQSNAGQYRILDDGSLDPDCAVGIMQSFAEAGYWAPKASFFCLIDVVPNDNALFGQEDRQKEKLHNLVDWGYEIGSNTLNNVDLAQASSDEVARQLALSLYTLEDFLDKEYTVSSLSLPYGHYPQSDSVLASGDYDGTKYKYTAALGLDGTLCVSPFSTKFAPLHIPRITATADNIAAAIAQLKSHRELMFISDGDSTTVSAPADFDSSLGRVRDDLGRPVVLY